MKPRSVSLSGQLIVTFAVLLAATVGGLTLVADRTSLRNLVDRALITVETEIDMREALLRQLFLLRTRRAAGFLTTAESHCSEPYGRRSVAWARNECLDTMLEEFHRTEKASGALLTFRGREVLPAGITPPPLEEPEGDWLALVRRRDGYVRYLTRGVQGEASLLLEFDDGDVLPLFEGVSSLGMHGDVVLFDESGTPLTPLRAADVDAAALAALASMCHSDPQDAAPKDYDGPRVIASFRRLTSLRGACLVAFMNYDEALAPAATALRISLLSRGAAFVLAGVLLSFIAAWHIAGPVKRLAAAARVLQAGDFTRRVRIEGPAEVQELARALAAMASDLSELVAREQSGRRTAEAANRSKDQFLAMLSHELRTPLTAVLGWAHTLRSAPNDPARVERAAIAIERSAESQRRLIEDLLDVTGIAAGRVRVNLEPTRLADVVDAALEAVRPRAAEKGVALVAELTDRDLVVHGDPQRLQQIVWNLVWNAVKFTPADGTVSVRVRGVGSLAELTVRDTGVGIDPEFLPHVFGWYRREDREERAADEGLGLGLALVRQLVELHGGSARAESAGRNSGSTFIVTLPLLKGDVPHGPTTTGVNAGYDHVPQAQQLASVRVLVVDDDPGSREAVRVLLEQVGADVTTVSSAADARRHLRASKTDVLVSDIAMEHETGYALIETLRAEGLMLPSVALTGYARREDADRAYAAGFDVHLPKPVDPAVLVSVVAALVKAE